MSDVVVKPIDDPEIGTLIRKRITLDPDCPFLVGADDNDPACQIILLVPGDGWPKNGSWQSVYKGPPAGMAEGVNEASWCSLTTETLWFLVDTKDNRWIDSGTPCRGAATSADEREPDADSSAIRMHKQFSKKISDYLVGLGIEFPWMTYVKKYNRKLRMIRLHAEFGIQGGGCISFPTPYCKKLNDDTRFKRISSTGTAGYQWFRCYDDGDHATGWEKSKVKCKCP